MGVGSFLLVNASRYSLDTEDVEIWTNIICFLPKLEEIVFY